MSIHFWLYSIVSCVRLYSDILYVYSLNVNSYICIHAFMHDVFYLMNFC